MGFCASNPLGICGTKCCENALQRPSKKPNAGNDTDPLQSNINPSTSDQQEESRA